jgi:hypothetical protein
VYGICLHGVYPLDGLPAVHVPVGALFDQFHSVKEMEEMDETSSNRPSLFGIAVGAEPVANTE